MADPQAATNLGNDRPALARAELTRLIGNVVIATAASTRHISVTSTEIDRQLASFAQQAGGQQQLQTSAISNGVVDLHQFARFYVTEQKIADQLVAGIPVSPAALRAEYAKEIDQLDQVHAAHILVKTKQLADSILRQVRRNPAVFGILAARYSIDTSNAKTGGDLGFQPQSRFVTAFADPVFAAKPGSFIEVHSQFGWHVVHVIDHRKVSLADATPQLRSAILAPQRQSLLDKTLTDEARHLGVHVNPRYGRWDFTKGQVVAAPASSELSSPAPSQ
jgi:parvulin-like peptidyl-prolyl isomerase